MTNLANIASALRADAHSALSVPAWALTFYRRHLVPILAISSVPAVERFVVVRWGSELPTWATTPLELVTVGARLLLLGVIFRLAISRDDQLNRLSGQEAWERMISFTRTRWTSLVNQLLLVTAAFVVFDVFPQQVGGRWVHDDLKPTYFAVLLAVKNLTVIAVTFAWMIGILRQMMLGAPDSDRRRSA